MGRNVWQLHYHAGVSVVERMDEMTRVQRVTLLKLEDYWSEKLDETPTANDIPSNPRGL